MELEHLIAMTCNGCHKTGMVPTQLPRYYGGVGIVGYTLAFVAVLAVGAGVGWGLAIMRAGTIALGQALIVTPIILVACTPLLIIGALRMFTEKQVWHCRHCNHVVERV